MNNNDITKLSKDWRIKKLSIKKYIINHLINLNYSTNSFFYEYIDKKIEKAFEKKTLKKIDYILFYYTSNKNRELYNKIIENFISSKISFYTFVEYDTENNKENNIIKTINLLEDLSKNTAKYSINSDNKEDDSMEEIEEKEKSWDKFKIKQKIEYKIKEKKFKYLYKEDKYKKFIKVRKKKMFDCNQKRKIEMKKNNKLREKALIKLTKNHKNIDNIIINLYTLFISLKKYNKNLIDIINNNYHFLKETIIILLTSIKLNFYSSYYYPSLKTIKDKKKNDFLNLQIYYFFKSIFDNDITNQMLQRYFEIPVEFNEFKYRIALNEFFENIFIQQNKKLNSEDIAEKDYQIYKQIIITFIGNRTSYNIQFKNTLFFLFEKDIQKFNDFLTIGNYDTIELSQIFIFILRKNLNKVFLNPDLFKLFYCYIPSPKLVKMNYIIFKYILNHAKIDKYSNLDFINNNNIFKDLDESLLCLNNINNQEASFFVVNKIKKIFEEVNTNTKLFLELIKRQIYNSYIFNDIFKLFNENELKEIYQRNKKRIIISLYHYSENNEIKYIQTTINNLSKFNTLKELKNIICPMIGQENNLPDYINEYFEYKNNNNYDNEDKESKDGEYNKDVDDNKEHKVDKKLDKIEQKNCNPLDDKNKYLLFYALLHQKIPNYETISILLEYCQRENGIYYLLYFFTDGFKNLFSFKVIRFFEHLLDDKYKAKIKALGNNLYDFIELYEKIYKSVNEYSKLNNIDKIIFYNYIIIFIFQIIPEKLIKFLGIMDKNKLDEDIITQDNKSISNNISEIELFIILSLYEIKGKTILPIKKYLPKFYLNIENKYKIFEILKIPKINYKRDIDTKLYEHFLYLIKQKTKEYINCIFYSRFKNFILIIQNEYLPNSELTIDNYESIDKLILNLINEKNILPFYKNNENEKFFTNLKLIDYKTNHEKRRLIEHEKYLSIEGFKKKRLKENENKNEISPKNNNNFSDFLSELIKDIKAREIPWDLLMLKKKIEKKLKKNKNLIEQKNYNKEEIVGYKAIIYSLLNFNETSMHILQNNSELIEKYKWENDVPLSIYINYLETIIEIYHYLLNKNEDKIYNIDVLEEFKFSENIQTKLNSMKNNINLNILITEIIKVYEKLGLNKNGFFDVAKKWINDYIISENEIMKEYKKTEREKVTILSYFKFLKENCNILIKTIEVFNKIKEILKSQNM